MLSRFFQQDSTDSGIRFSINILFILTPFEFLDMFPSDMASRSGLSE
ncbi:hypothetical protein ABHI18_008406 [Aspergillus niger]